MRFTRVVLAASLALIAGCSYGRRVGVVAVPEPLRREVEAAGVKVAYELTGDTSIATRRNTISPSQRRRGGCIGTGTY